MLRERNYRDFDDMPVNECGYLINELTGACVNKYTFEDVLVCEKSKRDLGELPMPYRLEQYGFNPLKCMGCFDYYQAADGNLVPVRLTNKFGQYTDRLYRPVNMSGFLINERGDVIDNQNRVRFIKAQLRKNGGLPHLYNYKGERVKVTEIIGTFDYDPISKEIILSKDPSTGDAIDMLGRKVSGTGYLLDQAHNIIKYDEDGN